MRWIPWIAFVAAALLLLAWSLCRISARSDLEQSDPLGSERDWPEPPVSWRRCTVGLFCGLIGLVLVLVLACLGQIPVG